MLSVYSSTFGGDKNTSKQELDEFLVQFEDGDLSNPKNWSRIKRWYLTLVGGLFVFNATFASSAPSGIVPQMEEHYHFSQEVATLTVSLFVAGYCVGPLMWGPLSEIYGRRPIFILAFFVYTCIQVGNALANNTASLLVFRFLGGMFAAAPLTNVGAVIGDIWDANTRGKALAIFTVAPFAGPSLGPIVSGFIAVSGASFRWVFWVLALFAGLCWVQIIFTIPETYAPVILQKKAQQKRKETGDERFYAPLDKKEKESIFQQIRNVLFRPFIILVNEPMLIAVTIYHSFVYGCIYLLFEAYPIVFTEGHHLNVGISGLMFLPIVLGGIASVIVYLLVFNPRYERAIKQYAPNPVPPERRLEIALYAGPLFAVSFFWFAWTSYPSISLWAPMMSGSLLGASIILIFLALFNYIIDAYLSVAASALAANTVCRSLAGTAFPLFATQMYNTLNPRWASSLLGFIALLMIPIPFVLMKYGPTLRANSKFAPSLPPVDLTQTKESDASPA